MFHFDLLKLNRTQQILQPENKQAKVLKILSTHGCMALNFWKTPKKTGQSSKCQKFQFPTLMNGKLLKYHQISQKRKLHLLSLHQSLKRTRMNPKGSLKQDGFQNGNLWCSLQLVFFCFSANSCGTSFPKINSQNSIS